VFPVNGCRFRTNLYSEGHTVMKEVNDILPIFATFSSETYTPSHLTVEDNYEYSRSTFKRPMKARDTRKKADNLNIDAKAKRKL